MSSIKDKMDEQLHIAEQISRTVHANQKDKLGGDYFDMHIEPVQKIFCGMPMLQCIAYLHDTIEDSDGLVTRKSLIEDNVLPEIATSVQTISWLSGSREHYILNIINDPMARVVKYVDINHNQSRLHLLREINPDKADKLEERYRFDLSLIVSTVCIPDVIRRRVYRQFWWPNNMSNE